MIPIAVEPTMQYVRCDGGWGALDTALGRLPLAAVDIDARVVGLETTTEVRQTFVNHHRQPIEATYVFPLPDRAAVQRFRMVAGDRVIEGELDERGAARDRYQEAIATGHRAALAEEDRAGVFTMTVGNLMPGDTVSVHLVMSGPVVIDDGEVTWQFPLVVAPRYVPGAPLPGDQAGLGIVADTTSTPDASRISPPVLLPGMPSPVRLGVRLTVDGGGLPVAGLRANLAEVDARLDGGSWQIALRPGQRLDRDLVLRWQLGGPALCSSAVWQANTGDAGATVAITLVPPVGAAGAGRPRDVAIVLDRSGSMEGWKMVAARRASARIIDSLTERDRFTVLAFDNQVESPPSLGAQLAPATDRNRFRAVEFLAGVGARGGTELAGPLASAARTLHADPARDQVLVLITDGQVGNEDQILAHLGRSLAHLRVFTLGIDQAVNAGFLRRLAAVGGGACELVESEDRLDEVMGKIHRRIATPILTGLAVYAPFLAPQTLAPRRLPALFAGAPVTIYCQAHGTPRPGELVEVTGLTPAGTPTTLRIAIDLPRTAVNLEAAWARTRIRDLEDQFAAGDASLADTIVAISKRHRVLSRFTAFVAIDRSRVVNPGGGQRAIVQPVEAPAGWAEAQVNRFAPPPPMSSMPTGAVPSMPSASAPYMPSASFPAPGPMTPSLGASRGGAVSSAGPVSFDDDASFDAPASFNGPASFSVLPPGGGLGAPPAPPAPAAPRAPAPAKKVMAPSDGAAKQEEAKLERRARVTMQSSRERHEALGGIAASGVDDAPYLARLRLLAHALEQAALAPDPAGAAQLPIARLAEFIDDARSVGLSSLVAQLEPLLARVRAALGTPTIADVLTIVSAATLAIAGGAPTPPTPPTPPKRRSFWK